MATIRRCPRCTEVLPATAAFCRRCGAGQSAMPTVMPVRSQPAIPPMPVLPTRSNRQWVSLFVVLAIIVFGLFYLGNMQPFTTPVWTPAPPQIIGPQNQMTQVQPMQIQPAYVPAPVNMAPVNMAPSFAFPPTPGFRVPVYSYPAGTPGNSNSNSNSDHRADRVYPERGR